MLVRGKCRKKTISFPLHLCAQTGSLRILLFQPRYYHPSTTSPRHINVFCRHRGKISVLFFSTIQTKHNSQSTTYCYIWHYEGRWNATCPALRQDIGPFEDLSVLKKFALVQHVVRTCFCYCLTKCIARATRTNHKTTASLFS